MFSQLFKLMQVIQEDKSNAFVFLTLTAKNCGGEHLSDEVDRFMKAWNLFTKSDEFKWVSRGYFRSFEITHNVDLSSKSYDTYHPHFHVILCVDKGYFKSRNYLNKSDWKRLWAGCMGLDYLPQIDVKRIEGDLVSSICEVSKYTVKSADYVVPDDWELTEQTVRLLDEVLHKRRFISFGGIFKDVHKKLAMKDLNNLSSDDLVQVEDQPEFEDDYEIVRYFWCGGYSQYRRG